MANLIRLIAPGLEVYLILSGERTLVAECLSQFAHIANKEKRAEIWSRAHQRWQAWGFDRAAPDGILMDISWSALDYALTGFYLECCTEADRDTLVIELRDQLMQVDAVWHDSLTACATQWFRIQSEIQPVVHAQKVAATRCGWLADNLYVVGPIDDPDLYFDHKHLIRPRC